MSELRLNNHFLVAMPQMSDPNFAGALTYVCEHSEQGALGLVVNRPIQLTLKNLFSQIGLELAGEDFAVKPVYYGGPVQMERGFVLHRPLGQWQSTLAVGGHMGLTTSKDILEAAAKLEGPGEFMVTLGYAGWGPGQIEDEIKQNALLTVEADPDVIFNLPPAERLPAALRLLGIDLSMLSDEAGHA